MLYCVVLCGVVWYCVVWCCVVWCCVLLCGVIVVWCYVVWCSVVLCCGVGALTWSRELAMYVLKIAPNCPRCDFEGLKTSVVKDGIKCV